MDDGLLERKLIHKNNLRKCVLFAGSIFFSIILIESFLYFFPALLPKDIQLLMERGPIYERINSEANYAMDDSILGFKLKPNLSHFKRSVPDSNEMYDVDTITLGFSNIGFRDDGLNQNKKRGIFLGDSFTFGYGVPLNETFVKQLEKLSGLDVVNMGVDSYSSLNNEYMLENYGINLSPNYIFWGLFQNDFVGSVETINWKQSNKSFSIFQKEIANGNTDVQFYAIRYFLAKNSAIYNLMKFIMKTNNFIKKNKQFYNSQFDLFFRIDYLEEIIDEKSSTYQIGMNLTKDALLKSASLAEKNNATFIVVIIPSKEQVYLPLLKENKFSNLDHPIKTLNNFCSEYNITCIDLLPSLQKFAEKGEKLYFKTDGHFTKRGHLLVAEIINQSIDRKINTSLT